MANVKAFVKNWTLPLSMIAGVIGYFVFVALPLSSEVHQLAYIAISRYIQPVLIFTMLFLSFLKVRIHEMKPRRWHLRVLLLQAGFFVIFSLLALACNDYGMKVLCEGAMLAFICPTATASAVITGRLGGSISGVVTYLMMCNLMVSILCPMILPLVEPHVGLSFLPSFLLILSKVFPLLICPLLLAIAVRYLMPKLHKKLLSYTNLSFDIWVVALALAITVTVRSIVHSSVAWQYLVGLAIISGICCLAQFWMGRKAGKGNFSKLFHRRRGGIGMNDGEDIKITSLNRGDIGKSDSITAGQAFGQKNTVFAIWLGLIFLDPVTSVVGGFYSVWHNTVNSWQLYQVRKRG